MKNKNKMRGRINNLARFGPMIFLVGLVLGPGAACGREAGAPPGEDEDGLRIVDFATDPVRPSLKSSWTNPLLSGVSRVAVSGNYAYLSADKLYMINVTNKTAPAKAGDYPIGSPRDVAVAGNFAYVVNQNTLEILNISNPVAPVHQDSETIVNGQAVAYADGLIYVADGDSGLKIYSVSDPQKVTLLGTYAGKAYDVDLWGNYGVFASDDSGVVMLDVSDPGNPVLQASLAITSRVVNRVSVSYDAGSHYYYVYTLDGTWKTGTLTWDQLSVIRIK